MTDEKQNMELNAIFAITNTNSQIPGAWGFGQDGDLIMRNSTDMAQFKELTLGHVLIMGRKTFESLGSKALPQRTMIVISKMDQEEFTDEEGCYLVKDIVAAVAKAEELEAEKAFVIGGADIINQALPRCSAVYYTVFNYRAPMKDIDVFMNMNLILNTTYFQMTESKEYREMCTVVKTGEEKMIRFKMMKIVPRALQRRIDVDLSARKKLYKKDRINRRIARKEQAKARRAA